MSQEGERLDDPERLPTSRSWPIPARPARQPVSARSPAILLPVNRRQVDPQEAIALARPVIKFAAGVVGDIDAFRIEQFVSVAIARVCDGSAAAGLQLRELCADAPTARSHADAHLDDRLVQAAEIVVRALMVRDRVPVIYEDLYTIAAHGRRGSSRLGADHLRGTTAVMRYIGFAAAGVDRHVSLLDLPFTTGTRDDHSDPRADRERIAAFGKRQGFRVPGPQHEHVDVLRRCERRTREQILRAERRRPELFAKLGVDPHRFTAEGFSDYVVVRELKIAPPERRGRTHARVEFAGDDPAIQGILHDDGRRGILCCGRIKREDDREPSPADLRRLGYEQLPPIDGSAFGEEWWFRKRDGRLARREVHQAPNGPKSVRTDAWQLLGLDPQTRLGTAIKLAQRTLYPWPLGCLERAIEDCAPGLLYVREVDQDHAMRALLRIADACIVSADRHRHRNRRR